MINTTEYYIILAEDFNARIRNKCIQNFVRMKKKKFLIITPKCYLILLCLIKQEVLGITNRVLIRHDLQKKKKEDEEVDSSNNSSIVSCVLIAAVAFCRTVAKQR
jgi:hypothetical protein